MSCDLEALFLEHPVGQAVRTASGQPRALTAAPPERWLLAVSGGRDSMVLLDAASRAGAPIAAVATYDHGTGSAARKAVTLVERTAERLGVTVLSGHRTAAPNESEATWRSARRAFLMGWAAEFKARIVTAHTLDDQIETVAIRILRGSGVRGLAAMDVDSGPLRPLLGVSRPQIVSYADVFGVPWVEDPSNAGRDFLRNRVRHDLLPAFEAVQPGFGAELAKVGRAAGEWRRRVDAVVDGLHPVVEHGALVVRRSALAPFDLEGLAVIWPALGARVGVTFDRRGTERLAQFTMAEARAGRAGRVGRIPLSGGVTVERTSTTFVMRPPQSVTLLY
ncbi:MAG: tRNA lysidine(34) synthetase TilS [Gemmatimonadetes bacterium]|nr:tRNA lysidine(34) synthetase TilS [Gemmatimonadota bacterium]